MNLTPFKNINVSLQYQGVITECQLVYDDFARSC